MSEVLIVISYILLLLTENNNTDGGKSINNGKEFYKFLPRRSYPIIFFIYTVICVILCIYVNIWLFPALWGPVFVYVLRKIESDKACKKKNCFTCHYHSNYAN